VKARSDLVMRVCSGEAREKKEVRANENMRRGAYDTGRYRLITLEMNGSY
jgi:hypothetical protein